MLQADAGESNATLEISLCAIKTPRLPVCQPLHPESAKPERTFVNADLGFSLAFCFSAQLPNACSGLSHLKVKGKTSDFITKFKFWKVTDGVGRQNRT